MKMILLYIYIADGRRGTLQWRIHHSGHSRYAGNAKQEARRAIIPNMLLECKGMKQVRISSFLHDVFGEKQNILSILGLLLSIGVGCIPLLPNIQPYMLITFLLFMIKVLFSFAVDHYGKAFQKR
ncbi:hypothetical protein [Brevibacillus panacihumi]|uniref:hypothetical protein n=1 Tax=Brevibacillus panacihumi TaxID=497735 RepID=UPI0011CD5B01|nr:hypothetical protein [Brevibacillus panacihumi]